jgi:hypothetical protein
MTNVNKTHEEINLGNYILVKPNLTNSIDLIKESDNKECLICLEIINIESGNLIRLPCKCTSSIYHKECIEKMLLYGRNKNFCPHCKQKYKISNNNNLNQNQNQNQHQYQNTINELERRFERDEIDDRINKTNICVTVFHTLFNSIINILSGNLIIDEKNINIYNKILLYSNIFKIFFNAFCIYVIKKEPEQMKKIIISSNIFQFLIFGYTVGIFIKYYNNSNKYTFIGIIMISIVFSLMDMAFRRLFRENRDQENRDQENIINFLYRFF